LTELTGRVTVRKRKFSVNASKGIRVPDSLVEEGRKLDRETFGACTSHDLIRESDVRSVVIRIQIFTIPATWKHQFETQTISALAVEERLVRQKVAVQGAFGRCVVVETVEAKGVLAERELSCEVGTSPAALVRVGDRVGEVAKRFVARNHAEAIGKGGDAARGITGICVQKVVSVNSQLYEHAGEV